MNERLVARLCVCLRIFRGAGPLHWQTFISVYLLICALRKTQIKQMQSFVG